MAVKLRILFFILFSLFFSTQDIFAQDSLKVNKPLVIGVTVAPPFVSTTDGTYSGLSVSSWKLVNEKLKRDFTFKEYSSLSDLLEGVQEGEVDFSINPITVTDKRMEYLEFSQPYFISHTGVAKRTESQVWNYLKNILSWDFFSAILILLGVIFIFGFLVWVFERKKNKEEFGEDARGILQGFWWSAVTMTTVGYGDKSPRTFGGRVVGLIWMFMAIILISSLTAGIASSLTVKNMNDEINSVLDLERFNVITVKSSSAQELLDLYQIESEKVNNVTEGIELLQTTAATVFVYDEPILKNEISKQKLTDELEVLQRTLKKDYYSYSFPKESILVKEIDPILISTLKTMKWNNLMRDYQ